MATKKEATVETQAAGHESSEHDVRDSAARGYRKARRGYVVSDKMDKTIVGRGRGPREAPALRQGHPPHLEGQGAR